MLKVKMNVFSRWLISVLVLVLALFVPFLTASAGSTVPTQHRRNPSFYVNADVGINVLNAPTTNELAATITGGAFVQDFAFSGRATNASPAASLGFGYLFPVNDWFNLGLRVFVHYENSFRLYDFDYQIPAAGPALVVSSRAYVKLNNWEYGADLTPSLNVGANQFLTGIFGLAFNRARIDVSGTETQNVSTVREFVQKTNVIGTRLGASLEQLLSPNFSLYMSYIWTGYGSVNLERRGPNHYSLINSNNFQTHNMLVGLKYYFSRQHYQAVRRAIANDFNRFYVSLSVGNLIPQISVSMFGNFFETSQNKTFFGNIGQGSPSFLGTLSLGRGFLFHHFYLGAEVLLNAADRFSRTKLDYLDSARSWLRTTNIQLNAAEGAFDLKVGGVIAPQVLVIGRIGVAMNTVRLGNLMDSNPSGVAGVGPQIIQNVKKRVAAPRVGVGIEKLFSNNFSLIANYVYTYYGHVSATATTSQALGQFLQSSVTARVATHAVTFGMNYYFA